jgi:SEC-C motif-containing protein
MTPRLRSLPCPCRAREPGLSPVYAQCCGRWHDGLAKGDHAPTPQALMRSRYSAYALLGEKAPTGAAMRDYLLATWHASTSPSDIETGPIRWTGLEILHEQTSGDSGVVEFTAHHKVNGRAATLHEMSRFVREGGAWRYIDGVTAPTA